MESPRSPAWIGVLNDQDLEFVKKFILTSGSLKALAKHYSISYPTVRLRLDRLIARIEIAEEQKREDAFESKLTELAAAGEITPRVAKMLLEDYRVQKEMEGPR